MTLILTSARWLIERPRFSAFLSALAISTSGIFVRLANVPPSTAAFYRAAYALPFLLVLAVVEQRIRGPRAWAHRRGRA